MKREWKLSTAITDRTIGLHHGYRSGRAIITVDGESIFERSSEIVDFGLEHAFTVDEIPCVVRIFPPLWQPVFFSYQFVANEALSENTSRNAWKVKMLRQITLAVSTYLIAGYLIVYAILSGMGRYYPAQSGRMRWSSGLSVTDMQIWQPSAARWRPYTNSDGIQTSKGNALGYLFSPLIRFDRAVFHPTEYYFESQQDDDEHRDSTDTAKSSEPSK